MGIVRSHKIKYDDANPRARILAELGDISEIEVLNNQVLVAIYTRPEKTAGGFIMGTKTKEEDEYQSKVGLIIAMGSAAFTDDSGRWFQRLKRPFAVGDWVLFRPSDGWELDVNDVRCRYFDDTRIKSRIPSPDIIW